MPIYGRHFEPGQLQFITTSTFRRALLARLQLPPTVHSDSYLRVGQRRYVSFNVFTEKKHSQKLDYMHHNAVKRRLVTSPDQWPWSSFRSYFLQDSSVLTMDRLA